MASKAQSQARLRLAFPKDQTTLNTDQLSEKSKSILNLTRSLVRTKSQGGIDPQGPVLDQIADWLTDRDISVEPLERPERRKAKNREIGLLASAGNPDTRPVYVLTACSDTASFGDIDSWQHGNPWSGYLSHDGWMYGRGTADSKIAVSMFSHLLVEMNAIRDQLNGRLILLVDSDEHTGRFGAIRHLVKNEPSIDGVFIGYPGFDKIRIGARGFFRARIKMYGTAAHTGASDRSGQDAGQKGDFFSSLIRTKDAEFANNDATETGFGPGPRVTISSAHFGSGWSMVPDKCVIHVDCRLTPRFQRGDALRLIKDAVDEADRKFPTIRSSVIDKQPGWPAYRLAKEEVIVSALNEACEAEMGTLLPLTVSGPSNVGNFLHANGIPAVCGFGVRYRSIHAPDECVDVSTIDPVYRIYKSTLLRLLSVASGLHSDT